VAKKLRERGAACGFTTSWPSWVNVENFFRVSRSADCHARQRLWRVWMRFLNFNNPVVVRHIAPACPNCKASKVFDYSGRSQSAEPRFQSGECAIFIARRDPPPISRPIRNSRSVTA